MSSRIQNLQGVSLKHLVLSSIQTTNYWLSYHTTKKILLLLIQAFVLTVFIYFQYLLTWQLPCRGDHLKKSKSKWMRLCYLICLSGATIHILQHLYKIVLWINLLHQYLSNFCINCLYKTISRFTLKVTTLLCVHLWNSIRLFYIFCYL